MSSLKFKIDSSVGGMFLKKHINSFFFLAIIVFLALAVLRVINLLDTNIVVAASIMSLFFAAADFFDYLTEKNESSNKLLTMIFYTCSLFGFVTLFSIVIGTALFLYDNDVFEKFSVGMYGDLATLLSLGILFLLLIYKNKDIKVVKADLIKSERIRAELIEADRVSAKTVVASEGLILPVGTDKFVRMDDNYKK
jgi:hypothetical protein